MTNKDKYLKEEITEEDIEQLAKDIGTFYENNIGLLPIAVQQFFNELQKPTLTEDERVILKNIDNGFTKIRREHGELYSYNKFTGSEYDVPFNHLFQFIKERRRI